MATLARSWQLLRSFRFEQTRPDIFYGGLASDTALLVDALCTDLGLPLSGARVGRVIRDNSDVPIIMLTRSSSAPSSRPMMRSSTSPLAVSMMRSTGS